MTNKDLNLNLNLDQRLTRQHTSASPTPLREVPDTANLTSPAATGCPGPKSLKPAEQQAGKPGVPLLAVLCMVLVNFLLLAAAGYWLLSRVEQTALSIAPAAPQADPQVALALVNLDRDLLAVKTQLEQLQASVSEQQQLISAANRDTEIHPQATPPQPEAVPPAPTPAVPARVVVPDNWVINVGTFPGRELAARLQQQLLDLGYQASVKDAESADTQAYRVSIPGYSDRQAAEQAVQMIMGQTELNGLWVSKAG